jgi:hypothetical protein
MYRRAVRQAFVFLVISAAFAATLSGERQIVARGGTPRVIQSLIQLAPYESRDLERFRHIWPVEASSPAELEYLWWLRAESAQVQERILYFLGEFRIVNWNAGATGENSLNSARDIADFILDNLDKYNANVLTLQELREDVHIALVMGLHQRSFDWTCDAHVFGADKDLRVTCVKGPTHNFRAVRLANHTSNPCIIPWPVPECLKNREWWGYSQVDYFGTTITNVHSRSAWDRQHANQLHAEVLTGIVAGDFNRERPDLTQDGAPYWHQTDLAWLPTHIRHEENGDFPEKIDHVLTVEPPYQPSAELAGKHGSSHEMLLTRFRLLVPVGPIRPGRGR